MGAEEDIEHEEDARKFKQHQQFAQACPLQEGIPTVVRALIECPCSLFGTQSQSAWTCTSKLDIEHSSRERVRPEVLTPDTNYYE